MLRSKLVYLFKFWKPQALAQIDIVFGIAKKNGTCLAIFINKEMACDRRISNCPVFED